MGKTILVTGVAGFIGSHVASALLKQGHKVLGIDNLNSYYSVQLKKDRLAHFFRNKKNFTFYEYDFSNYKNLYSLFKDYKIDCICHLGAQPGVRYSIEAPFNYLQSNINGTLSIFELARNLNIPSVIYASSSSVYGGNKKIPFSTSDSVDKPISLYAATKRTNELMAHTYHHLFGIKMTGLRFFTVYGPWGRPDMAMYKFTDNIIHGIPIDVYNYGKMKRDFTYISDIVAGVLSAIDKSYDFEILNLGNNKPIELNYFISCIEKSLGIKAKKNLMEIQLGDVYETFADIDDSITKLDFNPEVTIEEGVQKFVEWFKEYGKY